MLKILRRIAGYTGLMIGDLAMAFLNPYNQGLLAGGYRITDNEESSCKVFKRTHAPEQKRHTFSQSIYRLKRDGLIDEQKNKYSLTPLGRIKLKQLESQHASALPDPKYDKKSGDELKIVVFDIPETQARKRLWLRSVLKNLDYIMLQKSVWTGKTKIPELLIKDLEKLQLLTHIEILAVTKTGSLREII